MSSVHNFQVLMNLALKALKDWQFLEIRVHLYSENEIRLDEYLY